MECWLSLHSRIVNKPKLLKILRVTRKDDSYHVAILAHHKCGAGAALTLPYCSRYDRTNYGLNA
jgi:hypothetical protein